MGTRMQDEEDKAVKKRVAHLYENKHHLEAARSGQSAVEIDLFKMYDVDHSGTLSARELRRALGLVRALDKKSEIPGIEDIMAKLDADGDGEVTLAEWQELMPEDFKAGLRKLGHKALRISTDSTGIKGRGQMATADHRGQERAAYEEKIRKKKMLQRRQTKAAALSDMLSGNALDTESLFKQYDTDGSGKLSLRELRQALAGLDLKSAGTSSKELLAAMDQGGDGEVDIFEFEAAMPTEVREKLLLQQALKLASPAIRGQQPGQTPGLFGASPREKSRSLVDPATRPVHSDEIACPWRTASWKHIKHEEREEKLSGRGTFVFGQRVPYHGEIVLPSPKVDTRLAAINSFWSNIRRPKPPEISPQRSGATQLSMASSSSRWSRVERDQLLLKRSAVSKHINEAHKSTATVTGPHAPLLSALLSPRASPYAMPHKLPELGRPNLRQARQVSARTARPPQLNPNLRGF
eukprot:SAG31_NODE_4021_length_3659_cov_1.569382_1_plen_466_part_00